MESGFHGRQEEEAQRLWVEERLRRFEVRQPLRSMLLGLRLEVGLGVLNISFYSSDRDGGQEQRITTRVGLPWFSMMTPTESRAEGQFFKWLRWELLKVVTHEVDESLHVDGVRCWDPHVKGGN